MVAETRAQALDAAELIEPDYDPLPSVTETRAAAAVSAPRIWDRATGNLALDWQAGDAEATEKAFAEAAMVVRLSLNNQRVAACPLEPPVARGEYFPASGGYRLHCPSQGVHKMREVLARDLLKVPESALQVVTEDVGGAFGARIFPTVEHLLVLWAARLLRRPVRWQADREEAMVGELHGRDHFTEAALALDRDGRFRALRVDSLANLGAYVSPFARMIPTVDFAMALGGPYDIPACHARVRLVYSNSVMVTAYRGAGQPEATYVMERLVDAAAAELDLAPDLLRTRNLVTDTALPYRTAMGELYDSGQFVRRLQDARQSAAVSDFAERRKAARRAGRHRGLGMALYVKNNDGAPEASATLRFDPEGRLCLAVGNQSSGQGHETSYCQLVALSLGLDPALVDFLQGDSARIARGASTGGSAGLTVDGSAVLAAVEDLVARGKSLAARLLQGEEADLAFAVDRQGVGRYGTRESARSIALDEVARAAFEAEGRCLEGRGHHAAAAKSYANGCHLCEVEVDPETGAVEIVDYCVADDAGRLLNPALAEGQLHGGLAQGLGQALCEACRYDPQSGQLLSGSLLDYAPAAGPRPAALLGPVRGDCLQQHALRGEGDRRSRHGGGSGGPGERRGGCPRPLRCSPHRDALDARAGLARDPGGAGCVVTRRPRFGQGREATQRCKPTSLPAARRYISR